MFASFVNEKVDNAAKLVRFDSLDRKVGDYRLHSSLCGSRKDPQTLTKLVKSAFESGVSTLKVKILTEDLYLFVLDLQYEDRYGRILVSGDAYEIEPSSIDDLNFVFVKKTNGNEDGIVMDYDTAKGEAEHIGYIYSSYSWKANRKTKRCA